MISSLILNILGILLFLFIFWKKLREDFSSEVIFRFSFIILTFFTAGVIASNYFNVPYYFLVWFFSILLALIFIILRFKVNFFEVLESAVIGFLPWLSIFYLNDAYKSHTLSSFLCFLGTLFFMLIFYLLSLNYKKILWYKSGRVGFTGLVTLLFLFTSRFLIAIFFNGVVSFYRSFDIYISPFLMIVTIASVFYLNYKKS